MFLSFISFVAILVLQFSSAQVSPIPANVGWLNPAASDGDFAKTYTSSKSYTLSWESMNTSRADLWLTAYDSTTNGFAAFIKNNVDLRKKGSFKYKVSVAAAVLNADKRFVFRFLPHNTIYYPGITDQIPSPPFLVEKAPASSSTSKASSTSTSTSTSSETTSSKSDTTTTTTTDESTSTSASTQSTDEAELSTTVDAAAATATPSETASSPTSDDDDISDGAIAGISVAAAAGAAILVALGFFFGFRRRQSGMERLDSEKTPPGTAVHFQEQGYHGSMPVQKAAVGTWTAPVNPNLAREAFGNYKQPIELDSRAPADRGSAAPCHAAPTISHPSYSGTFSPVSPHR